MFRIIFFIAILAMTFGCAPEPTSSIGFRLPDGDVNKGLAAFSKLNCRGCHTMIGEPEAEELDSDRVLLGGKVTRVRTYGELVTSIINPSHKIAPRTPDALKMDTGQSIMGSAYLNDVMTVTELIDLVAYLQAHYEVVPPERTPYDRIYP